MRFSALLYALSLVSTSSRAAEDLHIGSIPTFDRPFFVEVYRQAIYVRARHECGLEVRDASMRAPRRNARLKILLEREEGTLSIHLYRGESLLASASAVYPGASWDAVRDVAEARLKAVDLLAPVCKPRTPTAGQEDPEGMGKGDVFSLIARINAYSSTPQGTSISDWRSMAALYSLVARKTEFLFGPYPKVFHARALAYAQMEAAASKEPATATLALAFVAAGRPADGGRLESDVQRRDDDDLRELVKVWAFGRRGGSTKTANRRYLPLTDYIAGLMESRKRESVEYWESVLKRNPADLTAFHFLLALREVDIGHHAGPLYLASVLASKPFLAAAAGKPSARAVAVDVPDSWPTKPFLSALDDLEGSDLTAEIPGSIRAVIALDFAFDAASRRLVFLAKDYAVIPEAEDLAKELLPLLAVHPWSIILPVHAAGPAVRETIGRPAIWNYFGAAGARLPYPGIRAQGARDQAIVNQAVAAIAPTLGAYSGSDPFKAGGDFASAMKTALATWGVLRLANQTGFGVQVASNERQFDDVRLDLMGRLDSRSGSPTTRSRLARRLLTFNPKERMAIEILAENGDLKADELLTAIQESPDDVELLRAGANMVYLGDADAREKLRHVAERLWKSERGDPAAGMALYGLAVRDGRLDEAASILMAVALNQDSSLGAATTRALNSRLLLRQAKDQEALAMASTAAESHSGDTLLNLAFVYERLGQVKESRATFSRVRDRYGADSVRYPRAMSGLRRGDRAAREEILAWSTEPSAVSRVTGKVTGNLRVPALILLGKWAELERALQGFLKVNQPQETEILLWVAVAGLRQGRPVREAVRPILRFRQKLRPNSRLKPVLEAFLGEKTRVAALEDISLTHEERTEAFYFLSQLARAEGAVKDADALLDRCYNETTPEVLQYTLAALERKQRSGKRR